MLHISCNMGTRDHDLPGMYALSPRALDIRTYQANHSCLCYNYYLTLVTMMFENFSKLIILKTLVPITLTLRTNLQ